MNVQDQRDESVKQAEDKRDDLLKNVAGSEKQAKLKQALLNKVNDAQQEVPPSNESRNPVLSPFTTNV